MLDRWPCAGLAVAVVADGGLAWFHGHGLADVEAKTPVSEETVFRVGSITKTFTAIAVMQLWEQGLVDLDAPANDYLRSFRLVPVRSNLRLPTVRHLSLIPPGLATCGGYRTCFNRASAPASARGDQGAGSCRLLSPGPACGGGAGDEVGVQQPRFRRARTDRRGRQRRSVGRYLRDRIFDPLRMEHTDLIRSERV